MKVKGIDECDFVNYKKPSMFISFSTCTFKCDKINGGPVCQNCRLAQEPNIEISYDSICYRYANNPLSKAFVFGGLEPFDSNEELLGLIHTIRDVYHMDDEIVIYTGYTEEEINTGWRDFVPDFDPLETIKKLKQYSNIIIKYGRYVDGKEGHLDELLGVKLASPNQYAKILEPAPYTKED